MDYNLEEHMPVVITAPVTVQNIHSELSTATEAPEITKQNIVDDSSIEQSDFDRAANVSDALRGDIKDFGIYQTFERLVAGEYDKHFLNQNQEEYDSPVSDEVIAEERELGEKTAQTESSEHEVSAEIYSSPVVPEELTHDPVFQQKVMEVMQEKASRGASLTTKDVFQEAHRRYQEEMRGGSQSREQQAEFLHQEFMSLKTENNDLRERLKQSEQSHKETRENTSKMIDLFTQMLKLMNKEKAEKDEIDKQSLFEMLLRMFILLVQELAQDGQVQRAPTGQSKGNQ